MKIVKHLRQDAARLIGVGVAVGLSATSTLGFAQAAAPAQSDAASTSTLSRSIFASVTPAPTLSPQLSAEIDHQIATSVAEAPAKPAAAVETAPETAHISQVSLAHVLPGHVSGAVRVPPKDGTSPKDEAISFEFPLPGYSVNSRFGLRQLTYEPHARIHEGVDIAAPMGSSIHATADGTVSRTGLSSSYGHFVEVAHADGLTSFYAHMSRTAGLEPGAKVEAGEVLGYVGSTGHSTGPHLHFEIRDAGKPLDPQAFMGRVFASASDLPLLQASATTAVFSHIRHPLHVLAAWHGRGRVTTIRYAADHRVHTRIAAG